MTRSERMTQIAIEYDTPVGGSAAQTARVAMPGTCGELVQGTIDGMPFLISCPIDLWSIVTVRTTPGAGWQCPADAPKAARGIRAANRAFPGLACGGVVEIASELPRGKGFASSTADVCGAIYALGEASGLPLQPEEVARLAVSVEPSDSTMFPGLALLDHRFGSQMVRLGAAPSLDLLVVDEGGAVDTEAFNRRQGTRPDASMEAHQRDALEAVRYGLESGDWRALGDGATMSAFIHQAVLPKKLLPDLLRVSRSTGALGICAAHSGTLLGLLLDPREHDVEEIARLLRARLPGFAGIYRQRMIDGGPRTLNLPVHPGPDRNLVLSSEDL